MNKKFQYILLFLRGTLWLSWFIAIFIIRYYPAIWAIDTAGHIASNTLFMQDGLHNFTDNWFWGFIQNLLYPPAENIINTILSYIFHQPPLQTFQIYLTLITLLYICMLDSLKSIFSHTKTKILYMVFCIFFLFLSKWNLTYFQWLWLIDLLYTGLTAQFLWWIWLLLLLKELFHKNRFTVIIWSTLLAVLSHIITGPIAMLLLLWMWYHSKNKIYIYSFCIILGLTSFFWLPFLLSMSRWTSSLIFNIIPAFLFWSLLLLYGKSHPKNDFFYKTLTLTTILILLPTVVNMIFPSLSIRPAFHYYRFTSIALFFRWILALWYIDTIDTYHNTEKKKWWLYISVAIFFLIIHFRMIGREDIITLLPEEYSTSSQTWKLPDNLLSWTQNRILLIDDNRSIDFHTDSMLTAYNPQASFIKWLYWESHYNNSLLSSYIATLFSEKNIVVDHVFLAPLHCSWYIQVMNNFINQYGIKSILIRPLEEISYLDMNRRQCLTKFLKEGSDYYSIKHTGKLPLNLKQFDLYNIKKLQSSTSTISGNISGLEYNYTLDIVQSLPPNIKFIYNNHQENPYWQNWSLVNGMIASGVIINGQKDNNIAKNIFALYWEEKYKDIIESMREKVSTYWVTSYYYTGSIDIQKVKTNLYKITTHTKLPTLLQIKLSYYPWWKLYNITWENLPLAPIDGWMIWYSNNETLYLKYTKPWYIYASYIISILSWFICLYLLRLYKKW